MLCLMHRLGYWAVLLALPAAAQTYTLQSPTIAGGGGTSAGGSFSLSGTIGQSAAGQMAGGSFTLAGGFWNVALMQQPSAPTLKAEQLGGIVRISWTKSTNAWRLQSTPALGVIPQATQWTPVPASQYRTNTTQVYWDLPAPIGLQFYRLSPATP